MDRVLKNINAEIGKVEGRTVGGLLAFGNLVLSRSNKRVPREYSNLFASGFARKAQGNPNAVEIGYGAAYAPFVHENLQAKLRGKPRRSGKGVYWGPKGEPRFLAKALTESQRDAAPTVAKFARVGK